MKGGAPPGDRDRTPARIERRRFLLGLGWGGLTLLSAAAIPALLRFLRPSGPMNRGATLDAGPLEAYRATLVSTRWVERHGIWIARQDGRLIALEARCTHLGCTTRWVPEWGMFRCPCHGSRFSPDGVPLNGPASLPLTRLAIGLERGRVVVDRSVRAPLDRAERDPRFFVAV